MTAFLDFGTLKVGDCRQLTKTITDADIRKFVELTGDDNPLHVDPQFANETAFKDIVVHGMLGASFISTVIGTKLPGPGALWVSHPEEIRSTPVAAMAFTVSKVIPPEASVSMRPATRATASAICATVMLSSNTASAPVARASSSCASESTSTSIFTRCPTEPRTRSIAWRTPPATATWLSLMSTASSSPKRWLLPPPARIACFSSIRRPGVVLRVQTMLAL